MWQWISCRRATHEDHCSNFEPLLGATLAADVADLIEPISFIIENADNDAHRTIIYGATILTVALSVSPVFRAEGRAMYEIIDRYVSSGIHAFDLRGLIRTRKMS